jgi:hypothetical protein
MSNVHAGISVQASNDTRCEPAAYTERGHELSLPNRPLKELLIDVLEKGAAFRFRAKGFSMSPFIKDSDVVTVAPVSSYKPRLGDVVVFINPDTEELVVHRVVGKKDKFHLLIKGDNLPTLEHLVSITQILGRVKGVERGGRTAALGLGPEKALIALLSRRGLLLPLLLPMRRIIRSILRSY